MGLRFEWDAAKAAANLTKHHVSFDEATTVFRNALARIFADEEHSVDEVREIIVGHSIVGRLLLISFTERTHHTIRLISARQATRTERKDHENKCKP